MTQLTPDEAREMEKRAWRVRAEINLERTHEPQLAEEARAGRLDPEQWRATQ